DESREAFVARLAREVADVVLEGIGNPSVANADPGLAHVELELITHEAIEDLVVVLVVAEHDVPANVPGEAGGIGETAGQPADVRQSVVDVEVGVSEFLEAVARAQAGGPGADDDDATLHRALLGVEVE